MKDGLLATVLLSDADTSRAMELPTKNSPGFVEDTCECVCVCVCCTGTVFSHTPWEVRSA